MTEPQAWPDTTPTQTAPRPAGTGAPRSTRDLRIEFTASGSEYFRIWIVNLLLTIVTLGFYYPFAKARRIRYFYANTRVDGQALAFHGDPWRMFRGFLLLGVLLAAYSGSGRVSPVAGVIAFCILAVIWPALWRASLQFRLGNTSWRGLKFHFSGGLREAYLAHLPLAVPMLPYVAIGLFLSDATRHQDLDAIKVLGLFALASGLVTAITAPWTFALLKQYQHGNYCYAGQRTELKVGVGSFYGLSLRIFGMVLVLGVLIGVAAVVIAIPLMGLGLARGSSPGFGLIAPFVVIYALFIASYLSYATSRTQNLVWGHTVSPAVQFCSRLSARELFKLTFINWLLTLVTLSLYRPFAAVATTRLRLAALTIEVSEDIDTWVTDEAIAAQDASGDAAADFFGIDIGL